MKFKAAILSFLIASLPVHALAETNRDIFASSLYNFPSGVTGVTGYLYVPTTTPFGNRACYFDNNSTIASSITTATELSYVHGATSNIQDQINAIVVGGQGPTGATGPTGANGITGATGVDGQPGQTGATGSTGMNGSDGAMGATGSTGGSGPMGPQGAQGLIGSTGATGSNGSDGVAGATGATGSNGSTGGTGSSGIAIATTPLVYNAGTQTVSIQQASSSQAGYLSSTDWNTFNGKQSALTFGDFTGSSPFAITGGTGSVIGSGVSLGVSNGYYFPTTTDQLAWSAPPYSIEFHACPTCTNVVQTGSYNQPYLTVQAAINAAKAAGFANSTVYIHGSGSAENLVINDYNANLLIESFGSTVVDNQTFVLSGTVTISGLSTRIRLKDIKIVGPGGSTPDLMDSSAGRNYFSNVGFESGGGIAFTGSWARWHEFTDCTVSGPVSIAGTPAAGSSVSFWRVRGGANYTINSSNATLQMYDSFSTGNIVQTAGVVELDGGRNFVVGSSLTSTTNNTGDLLSITNANLETGANTWYQINKTGTAPYVLSNLLRNEAGDVLTGTRLNQGATATDEKYVAATPTNWPSLPPSVAIALDDLAARFAATGTTGPTGATGATGGTGSNGTNGATGGTGSNGTNGATGGTGSNGTNGATGGTGSNGTNGATGATGGTGSNGTNGATGATGGTGSNGTNGATGATGGTGSNGTNGATGATGGTGSNGTNGATGATGGTGSNGTNGATGATGGTGSNGTNGATGGTGSNGTNGATGATGGTGSNGTNGATGATGGTGSNGTNGATGATGGTGSNGTNGATGATGGTGSNGTNGATGATGGTGSNGTNGATGATGGTGSNGTNGATGATGATGVTGSTGATGSANVSIATVSATSSIPVGQQFTVVTCSTACSQTLPALSSVYTPGVTVFYDIQVSGAGAVTVLTSGSDTINGSSSAPLNFLNSELTVAASSAGWIVK